MSASAPSALRAEPATNDSQASESEGEQKPRTEESDSTTSESSVPPEYEVETVAEPSDASTSSRQPSGWVSRLTPDGTFARGGDLGDVLERTEGVTVRRRSSLGQPAYATVRGGSPRQLAVHLNGVRIGAPTGLGFDVGTLSTGWIDAVDVYRGGAAAPWGSGALTGALDLQMRPPTEPGWKSEATVMSGSFGTVGLSGHAAGGSEGLKGDFTASWRRSRGDFRYVDGQGTPHTRVNNDHRQLSTGGTVGTSVGGGDLTGAVLYESLDRGAPGPSEFQDAYRRATLERRRAVGTVSWEKRGVASPDWGVIDLKFGGGGVHRPLHYRNPDGFLGGSTVDTSSTHNSFSARTRVSGYFDAGNITHLNLDVRAQSFDADYGWNGDSALHADRQTLGLGISDELLILDESVSLIAGLRTELVSGRDGLRVPSTPSGGVIWRALDWLRLKANVSRSHRIPDFDELYLRTETVRGNPNLEPERAWNVDAGAVVGSRRDLARGKLTFFSSDIERMILFLPQTAYQFQAENLPGATSRGLEAAGSVEIGKRLGFRGSYTYTDAHLDSLPDVQLPHHPSHRGLLAGRAELGGLGPLDAVRSLRLSAEASGRSSVNLDNFGSLSNAPYAELDLGASLQPNETFTFGLELRNVTDNRRGADFLHRPLPGRSLYASVRLRDGTLPP